MELLALADSAEDWIYIPGDYLSKLIKLASPHPLSTGGGSTSEGLPPPGKKFTPFKRKN